jgi:hypothetical protein
MEPEYKLISKLFLLSFDTAEAILNFRMYVWAVGYGTWERGEIL